MIRPDGTIHFAEELLGLVDRFLEDYQDIEGDLPSELDRGLVAAYALSALQCDLELVRECLATQAVFGYLSPMRVLDECSDRDPEKRAARMAETMRLVEGRAWVKPR
ncbi:MAG: hypothetical protein ACYCYF_13120 [Anaerolineae bacterium]